MDEFQELNNKNDLIIISFVISIIISAIPLPFKYFYWLPEWLLLTNFFWIINKPDKVGIFITFTSGIIIDLIYNLPLGTNSFSLCIEAIIIIIYQKKISNFLSFGLQSLLILFLILFNKIITAIIIYIYIKHTFDYRFFISPFTTALIWPIFNKIMIKQFIKNS